MPLLQIQDLRKGFRAPDGQWLSIIELPSFELAPAAQVALRGGSGTGKTTLLHLIAGILRPDAGRIVLAGTELSALGESARDQFRARQVGYVFQSFNLLQGLSALENVLLAMTLAGQPEPARARALLERVGLGARLDHRPAQLSVGQQQRVAVARALAKRPALVLADEPTGNLDAAHAGEVVALIREVCAEEGAGLLLVSHDRQVLAGFSDCRELAVLNRAAAAHAGPASSAAPTGKG